MRKGGGKGKKTTEKAPHKKKKVSRAEGLLNNHAMAFRLIRRSGPDWRGSLESTKKGKRETAVRMAPKNIRKQRSALSRLKKLNCYRLLRKESRADFKGSCLGGGGGGGGRAIPTKESVSARDYQMRGTYPKVGFTNPARLKGGELA